MWAVFITGLADLISLALLPIPGLGIILAFAITFCINATMGMGLLIALISNGMFHPKFGPAGLVLGMTPPFNVLPIWIGLVIAGIVHDMSNEKGALGEVAKLADSLQSAKNPFSKAGAVLTASSNMRLSAGRPPVQPANDHAPQEEQENKSRALPNLKSPSLATNINSDIAPARVGRTQPYAKAA